MEKIIESANLESQNSLFIFDKIEYKESAHYIKITQFINNSKSTTSIHLNPNLLDEFIRILQSFKEKSITSISKKWNKEDIESLIANYFKGIPFKNLVPIYNCSVSEMKKILLNNEIEVVDNEMPKNVKKLYRRKKY